MHDEVEYPRISLVRKMQNQVTRNILRETLRETFYNHNILFIHLKIRRSL